MYIVFARSAAQFAAAQQSTDTDQRHYVELSRFYSVRAMHLTAFVFFVQSLTSSVMSSDTQSHATSALASSANSSRASLNVAAVFTRPRRFTEHVFLLWLVVLTFVTGLLVGGLPPLWGSHIWTEKFDSAFGKCSCLHDIFVVAPILTAIGNPPPPPPLCPPPVAFCSHISSPPRAPLTRPLDHVDLWLLVVQNTKHS